MLVLQFLSLKFKQTLRRFTFDTKDIKRFLKSAKLIELQFKYVNVMNQQITLQVSENVWLYAKAVATRNKRQIEEVLSDWLEKVSSEIDVEKLSDSEVLALSELQLSPTQQELMDDFQEKTVKGNSQMMKKYSLTR